MILKIKNIFLLFLCFCSSAKSAENIFLYKGNFSRTIKIEELRSFQKTALAREKINTPSHSQVIKPIYNTSSYRWKSYEEYLDQYKTRLAPWIQEYGYSN